MTIKPFSCQCLIYQFSKSVHPVPMSDISDSRLLHGNVITKINIRNPSAGLKLLFYTFTKTDISDFGKRSENLTNWYIRHWPSEFRKWDPAIIILFSKWMLAAKGLKIVNNIGINRRTSKRFLFIHSLVSHCYGSHLTFDLSCFSFW